MQTNASNKDRENNETTNEINLRERHRPSPHVVIYNNASLLIAMDKDFDESITGPDDETMWYRRKPVGEHKNRLIIGNLEIIDRSGAKLHEFDFEMNDKFGVALRLEDGSKLLVRSGEKFTIETYSNKLLAKATGQDEHEDQKLPIRYRHKDADGHESRINYISVGDVGGLEFKPIDVPTFDNLKIRIWLKSIWFSD